MKEGTPRLGKGLAALFGDGDGLGGSAAVPGTLPIRALKPSPFQPRAAINASSLAELTTSIRKQGVLQPVLVRPHPAEHGVYEIIAGERRWRAAQAAGLVDIPVLVRNLSDLDAMAAALVENLQRQDLNPIEEAEGYFRLVTDHGMTHDQLGEMIGKSRSHIANTIRLLQLEPNVVALVRAGTLTAGHARALLTHPDQQSAADAVVARGLNVRQTEALARDPHPDQHERIEDPETAELERELSEHLGLKVQIKRQQQRGHLSIKFSTLEQLDGLILLLNPN